jgi:hypothetical protein
MTPKPSRVLIIGSGPIVIAQAVWSPGRRLVDDAAGADDLAQKGVPTGIMVLAGGIADRGQARLAANCSSGYHPLPFPQRKPFEIGGNDCNVDVTPFVRRPVEMRSVKYQRLNTYELAEKINESREDVA